MRRKSSRVICQRVDAVTLDVKITSVYSNEALPATGLKSGHGESFHIKTDDKEVLFDVGWKVKTLMNNMERLGIKADNIGKLVLSHRLGDHAGGLQAFLKARTGATPVRFAAHPDALETKSAKTASAGAAIVLYIILIAIFSRKAYSKRNCLFCLRVLHFARNVY